MYNVSNLLGALQQMELLTQINGEAQAPFKHAPVGVALPGHVAVAVTQHLVFVHCPVAQVPVVAHETPVSVWPVGQVPVAVPAKKFLEIAYILQFYWKTLIY